MRRFTHLVILIAFIFSCGGHWAVYQSIAWANMIREYSTMVPFTEAVSMTFSGKYPCSMCKAIAKKKSSEQQKTLSVEKFDKKLFSLDTPSTSFLYFSNFSYPNVAGSFHPERNDSPPIPPPRLPLI